MSTKRCQSNKRVGHTENRREEYEEVIAREVKSAMTGLVSIKVVTMVEEFLDDILRKTFHNGQSSV